MPRAFLFSTNRYVSTRKHAIKGPGIVDVPFRVSVTSATTVPDNGSPLDLSSTKFTAPPKLNLTYCEVSSTLAEMCHGTADTLSLSMPQSEVALCSSTSNASIGLPTKTTAFLFEKSSTIEKPDTLVDEGRPKRRKAAKRKSIDTEEGNDGDLMRKELDSETKSSDYENKDDGERFVCQECGKQYTTASNLTRHRQTHRSISDKTARKCPHCDRIYVSSPAYNMVNDQLIDWLIRFDYFSDVILFHFWWRYHL